METVHQEPEFVITLEAFEGPIDLLLSLAREQKVDLTQISIKKLADQYLEFIDTAKDLNLEVAADYLVMAAWLVYLKSRLLLPDTSDPEDEPTGEELAEALSWQLKRLESMRDAGQALYQRPLMGRDVFARGDPEDITIQNHTIAKATIYNLLAAYSGLKQRKQAPQSWTPKEFPLWSIQEALQRLSAMLGRISDWTPFESLLIQGQQTSRLERRSSCASSFVAGLELAKKGALQIRQEQPFSCIYVRSKT